MHWIKLRYEKRGIKIKTNVGSGLSDDNRDKFWQSKDKLIGQIVEVRADAITKNQDSEDEYSLRFPRFMRFRGFEIGENFSNVTEILGEIDVDENIKIIERQPGQEDLLHGFVTTKFEYWCPDHHPKETEIRIYALNEEPDIVLGYKLLSSNHISLIKDKKSFLFYYIQDNFKDEVKEVFDKKWLGHVNWQKDGIQYYYSKLLKFDALIVEELIITKYEYRKRW